MTQDSQLVYEVLVKNAGQSVAVLGNVQKAMERLQKSTEGLNQKQKATAAATLNVGSAQQKLANSTNNAAGATNRASKAHESYALHIAKTTVQSAAVNKLFLEFVDVAGQAVQAVDLMANFPATMASMGQSTRDASVAMDALRKYVGQVGGNIQQATSYVTRFTGVTKDVKAATAIYTGLNNALIAGDSSQEEQKQALLQFAQALERGKPDMREWNSLSQNMSFQLQQVAKKMGYVNANALGTALRDGEESMAAFTTTLTEMSTGTGVIAKQAMTRMQGMQFAFNVLKNTLVTGLATIIQTIGRSTIVSFFTFLTQAAIAATEGIVFLVNALVTLFNAISRLVGGPQIGKIVSDAHDAASGLAAGAAGAGAMDDNLKDAQKDAKELNKSLASFDKMNVLDKGKGAKDDGDKGAKGTNFDPGQLGKLSDAFGDIEGGIAKAGLAAKIFAGILAALALRKPLIGLIQSLADMSKGLKQGATGADNLSKKIGGLGKSLKDSFKGDLSIKDATKSGQTLGYGFMSGLSAAIGAAAGKAWKLLLIPLAAIAPALITFFGTIGAAVAIAVGGTVAAATLPLWLLVAIGVAIVAAIVAAIWLIWTNWDKIWGFIKKAAQVTADAVVVAWKATAKFFGGIWDGIKEGAKIAWDAVVKVVLGAWESIKNGAKAMWDFIVTAFVVSVAIILTLFQPIIDAVVGAVNTTFLILAGVAVWIYDNVISPIVKFYVGMWKSIVGIFIGVAKWFGDRFQDAFNAIVSIWVAFDNWMDTNVWIPLKNIFIGVGKWFGDRFREAWNAVVAVWTTVASWFNTFVWIPIKNVFSQVIAFYGGIFTAAWNVIKGVWGAVASWFAGVWNGIVGVFNQVVGFFSNIFRAAWNGIVGIFSGIGNWFRLNVVNPIVAAFSGIGGSIGGFFKGAINGIIDLINNFVKNVNKNITKVNAAVHTNVGQIPLIPKLAKGGVVTQGTLAVVGENGSEAVMPLENNTGWIDELASKINSANGRGGGQPIALTVQIGEEKIATKVIELINEKTQMSGRNAIIV